MGTDKIHRDEFFTKMVIFGFAQDLKSIQKIIDAIYSHRQHGEAKLPPLVYIDFDLY